ncbi:hypothetical protein GE253_20580 [Niveispirillum sp. SYP-B3756]|uniref:hypothetical protein n=1 Tax=Niveispirillum sp. SYP-B3756 TaxID=2662178 RepID=UPI0012921F29|nr:hypothetical protein [Niveispirillum sp. SYP-B3756]MQP67729.1 hypothetical protein [Niveispirillum sp. SYP-B3756]
MFCVGHGDGYIAFAKQADILTVRLCLDASSHHIVIGFKIAQQLGWLSPDNALVIDLRRFIGSVDWACVRELRELAPWIDQPNSHTGCAYLLEVGDMRRYLINVVSALYPAVCHRSFTEEAAALDWLADLAVAGDRRPCLRRA